MIDTVSGVGQATSTVLQSQEVGPVVFLCPSQWGIRNVIHSGVLARLRKQGARAYILSGRPNGNSTWYVEHGMPMPLSQQRRHIVLPEGHEDAEGFFELDAPPMRSWRRGTATMNSLQRASYFSRHKLTGERSTVWWYRRHDNLWERVRNASVELLAVIGGKDPFYRWQMAYMENAKRSMWNFEPARQLLEKLRPSLVVATSCVIWVEEPYLIAARDMGIRTLGCIQSFDNLTSRNYIPKCDDYACWNQRMHDQLIQFYPERNRGNNIHITGTPQFDFHVRDDYRWTREEALKRLGLEPGDRYILYAANSYHQTPTEPKLVEELAQRMAQIPELKDLRLVVRLHPQDEFNRWDGLRERNPRIVVSWPSSQNWSFTSPDDQALLVNSLRHAEVCLNMWSTMSMDAAAVGTPVVCVAFAGERGGMEDRFCRSVYNTDYYVPILASGGVRLAYDMDQLVSEVTAYVKDRTRDQAGRAQLVRSEVGQADGHAADRVAELILNLIGVKESR